MEYYVYIYREPRTCQPIYVGLGRGKRAIKHLTKANNPYFQNVINQIRAAGLQPVVQISSGWLSLEEASFFEMAFIKQFGRRDNGTGCLCNLTDGGEGVSGYKFSDSTVAKRAKTIREGWKKVDREKLSKTLSVSQTPEMRAACSKRSKNRPPEVLAKISASSRLRMQDPVFKAKVLAATQTEEANKKRSSTITETLKDPIKRAEKSRITKELWADPEFRAKMKASRKVHASKDARLAMDAGQNNSNQQNLFKE